MGIEARGEEMWTGVRGADGSDGRDGMSGDAMIVDPTESGMMTFYDYVWSGWSKVLFSCV